MEGEPQTHMNSIKPLVPTAFSAKIALSYAAISVCWILFSDYFLGLLLPNVEQIMMIGTIKGIAFVSLTALFLFLVLLRETKRYMSAYETLKENERTIRMTMEATNIGTWTWDITTNKTSWSDENYRLLGYEPGAVETNYETWKRAVHPEDRTRVEDSVKKAIETKTGLNFEYRVQHGDGSIRWLQSIAKIIFAESGEPVSMYGIKIDITEQKKVAQQHEKLEKQLQQAQKMEAIGQLAGGVAHDYNNMLSVILGYTDLLKSNIQPDDPMREDLLQIEAAAIRSRDMTRQLLAFSRRQTVEPTIQNLNQLIENSKKPLSRLIGEDIKFRFLPAEDLWNIKVDSSQIDQIVFNLAVNSRDAMPDGGKLTLQTENMQLNPDLGKKNAKPRDYVSLTVIDTGCGMDEETLSHVFEPFFTTKTHGKGTGLGLATVYGIVKQNNGLINVYSEPGKGTTFKIYFPRCTEKKKEQDSLVSESPEHEGGTVLLVEDDNMVRRIAAQMLRKLGYTAIVAASPAEALVICKKITTTIDLLLVDVIMPDMNGTELREKIHSFYPDIRTLFMSGYTTKSISQQGKLQRNCTFIQKPFGLQDLDKKIKETLGKQPETKQ